MITPDDMLLLEGRIIAGDLEAVIGLYERQVETDGDVFRFLGSLAGMVMLKMRANGAGGLTVDVGDVRHLTTAMALIRAASAEDFAMIEAHTNVLLEQSDVDGGQAFAGVVWVLCTMIAQLGAA